MRECVCVCVKGGERVIEIVSITSGIFPALCNAPAMLVMHTLVVV